MNNKGDADLMSQMINAGHIQQDSHNTIVLNSANGEQRFAISVPQADANANFDEQIQNEYEQ